LATAPERVAVAEARQTRPSPNMSRALQRPLFPENPDAKVIPFEAYAPAVRRERAPRKTDAAKPAAPRQPRRSRVPEGQGSLDFLPSMQSQPRTLGTTVEAVIFCEAPVATPVHRAVAAAMDWAMVLAGYVLFLAAYALAGGEFVLTRANLLVFLAALPLIAFTYGAFWTIAGTESAGMRWTHLKLITFDGFPPEPRQRIMRLAGSCLSFCTIVGLLWSLADEESLTWQDHMSRTFPTPKDSESRVFQRH